jgi:hypothetical protein
MKGGAENRKKTLMAGGLGAVALCCILYAANALFGGSSAPAPVPVVPTTTAAPAKTTGSSSSSAPASNTGLGVAPGVAAKKMASTSSSLDPTLDESAMLRTESLVYSGTGRNIFSAIYVPPVEIPKNAPSARPVDTAPVVPTGPPPPPPPPPINLKFFGVETHANGKKQAFLLSGDDVYLASEGDIVERKYKVVSISANSVQVEDLSYKNTQTIPLQQN